MEAGKQIESINQYIYDEGNFQREEKIGIENNEENIINKVLVSSLIENLKLRDKEIIELRYFEEKTQSQVAQICGISQVQVSRIERRVLKELKQELIRGESVV